MIKQKAFQCLLEDFLKRKTKYTKMKIAILFYVPNTNQQIHLYPSCQWPSQKRNPNYKDILLVMKILHKR